jgi:hypothetical protein
MEKTSKVELRLPHHVDVGEAANYLLGELGCDNWSVACQREHLLVIHLSKGDQHKYAVCFECSPPVEKAIYHGSKAWSLSMTPLGNEPDLLPAKIAGIKVGLVRLGAVARQTMN